MNDSPTSLNVLTRLELYFSIRHVIKAMKLFGKLFDHDYDMVAIFLTVAEASLRAIFHLVALDPKEIDVEKLYADLNAVGMTALSIGELTGIPRETVRRKVRALIDRGYLAVSQKEKNIYLPASTITSLEVMEIFGFHLNDVGQLVRSVSYYQRDETPGRV
jgi:hypothetical protein